MKILMTTSFYPPFHIGGDALHVKGLAEALVEKGHEVHVMHSLDAYDFKRDDRERIKPEKSKVKVHSIKAPDGVKEVIKNYTFGTQKYTYDYYQKLIKKYKFDIVHHHNISLLGWNILKKIGKYKQIYTAHDYWLVCHKYDLLKFGKTCEKKSCFLCCLAALKPYQFFRHTKAFNDALQDIDIVIAPSKFMKQRLSEIIDKKKIKVVYNFSNIELIENPKEFPMKDYYLFVGVLERHKGIIPLLKTFRKLKDRLVVVGDGQLWHKARALSYNKNNIKLMGRLDHKQILPILRNAKALIMPSLCHDNCPLTIMEAYSLGIPVIGSNLGGIPELVNLNNRNLVFDYKDMTKLKEIIIHFSENNKTQIKKIYRYRLHQSIYLNKYSRLIK